MKTLVLLVFLSVFPTTILGRCADIASCGSGFYNTKYGVHCTTFGAFISCLKSSACDEERIQIAESITNLDQVKDRVCSSTTASKSSSVSFLSVYGAVDALISSGLANCSALSQCHASMPINHLDISQLSMGNNSQICSVYKPVTECWQKAIESCDMSSQILQLMYQSQRLVQDMCSQSNPGMASATATSTNDFLSKLFTGNEVSQPGCNDFRLCVMQSLPQKDGRIDVQALQNIKIGTPSMCRIYYSVYTCIENADSKCLLASKMKQNIGPFKKHLISVCGSENPNAAGIMTSGAVLNCLLAVLVAFLYS